MEIIEENINFNSLLEIDKEINEKFNKANIVENEDKILATKKILPPEIIEKFFATNTGYKSDLIKSMVISELIKVNKSLKIHNIHFKDSFKVVASLANFIQTDTYTRFPDLFITKSCNLGRNIVTHLIYILNRTEILKIKKQKGIIYIKLNQSLIRNDNYIQHIMKRRFLKDQKWIIKCTDKYSTVYCKNYYFETVNKYLRESFIGITLAYNFYKDDLEYSEKYKNDLKEFGKRKDIYYAEMPIHLIATILRIPLNRAIYYAKQLCTFAPYISKRDKVYQSFLGQSVYYDANYQSAQLVYYKKAVENEDRLQITPFSCIIYPEELMKTRLGKSLNKKFDDYKKLVLYRIQKILADRTIKFEKKDEFKQKIDDCKLDKRSYEVGIMAESSLSVVEMAAQKTVHNSRGKILNINFEKLTIKKAVNYMRLILQYLENEEYGMRYIKYNIKLFNKLKDFIQNKIYELNKLGSNISNVVNLLSFYNLLSMFKLV